MSLTQSARMNGHDPYAYLKDVLTQLPTQRASEIGQSVAASVGGRNNHVSLRSFGIYKDGAIKGAVTAMILVVEGISASGKTTWCAKHGGQHVIPENGRFENEPDRLKNPVGAATFWAERNVERWQKAVAMEDISSRVLCDSDPLKLHYIWSLWQIGEASEHDWLLELDATRETIAQGRIGFADCYIVGRIDPQLARERAKADKTRRRGRFELHVRLQHALLTWYSVMDRVLPGRLQFGFPSEMPAVENLDGRYSVTVFDQMIASLPGK